MYHDYSQEELRAYCRTYIETLEMWARRLIDEKMTEKYGSNYMTLQTEDGNFLVKTEIRNHVARMKATEPDRFSRDVDTLFFEHLVYFLCNNRWYNDLFADALRYSYPQGSEEARVFLERLQPIRNPLSHTNPISMHDVERAICYSHDFVEGLKQYYKARGEEQVWNVPQILKIKDSLGNVFENVQQRNRLGNQYQIPQELGCGDTYSVEIEIDPSFSPEEYTINWNIARHTTEEFGHSNRISIRFDPRDVGETTYLYCTVVQNKEWHKYGDHDSKITLVLTVLPPI